VLSSAAPVFAGQPGDHLLVRRYQVPVSYGRSPGPPSTGWEVLQATYWRRESSLAAVSGSNHLPHAGALSSPPPPPSRRADGWRVGSPRSTGSGSFEVNVEGPQNLGKAAQTAGCEGSSTLVPQLGDGGKRISAGDGGALHRPFNDLYTRDQMVAGDS